MAGYASLVGMALFFAIMFRLKWAVRPKTALGSCISVLIAANLICMHTASVPVLVGVSLVAGFFRMWAIYECNSTIQLWITPKRDMSIWFCYIYLMVNGTIQLTGIAALSLSVWASWHYMYWLIIGALLVDSILISSLLGVFAFSSFWTIKEVFDQRKRVLKGWFPMNPKRKHEYE